MSFCRTASSLALTLTLSLGAASQAMARQASPYGSAVANAAATTRTVDIATLKKPFVNVRCGDTVVFKNGDKTFAWKFDVMGHNAFDLQTVAPKDFLRGPLKVYVASNSLETS